MKNDIETRRELHDELAIRDEVHTELQAEPGIDASGIGVSDQDGVVRLSGTVTSVAQKKKAEEVAKRIYGVKEVVNDIQVMTP